MSFRVLQKERLKRRNLINRLFNREGKTLAVHPLRIIWLETPLHVDIPVQFTVSVPKRAFAKAAHRNRIRRQIKEAFRLKKHLIHEFALTNNKQFAIILLYTGKRAVPYEEITKNLDRIIERFIEKN